MDVAGRPVRVYLPDDDVTTPRKRSLLLLLHGFSSSPEAVASFFGLPLLARQRGMVVATPEGSTNADGDRFWNAGRSCCDLYDSKVDDSTYLETVVDALIGPYGIDPTRVFVAGHSNGGYMALRFACEHAERVAAVVSVAGAMDVDGRCVPVQPVSVLQVHGDADESVLIGGGNNHGYPYTSAAQTVATWRGADGCPTTDGGQTTRPMADDPDGFGEGVTATNWTGCRSATEVALWTIAGAGHVPVFSHAVHVALLDWLEQHSRAAR